MKFECLGCHKIFYKKIYGGKLIPKFCSNPCRYANRPPQTEKQKLLTVLRNIGNKWGSFPKSEEHKRKISEANKGRLPTKGFTGMKFSLESKEKLAVGRRGDKSWCWKGGITPLYVRIRHMYKSNKWREDILERDGAKCQLCGSTQQLQVDHLKPFALIMKEYKITSPEIALTCQELWDIKNGRTLCFPCHRKTINYGKNLKSYGNIV